MHGWTLYEAVRLEQELRVQRLADDYERRQQIAALTSNGGGMVRLRRALASALFALAARIGPSPPVNQPEGAVGNHA